MSWNVTPYSLVIFRDVWEKISDSIFYHKDGGRRFFQNLITGWRTLYACGNIKNSWSDLSEEFRATRRLLTLFFYSWRAPQQTLRKHRSLEAYCAILKVKMIVIFCPFPTNGAPVEWNWQGKTEVLREKPDPVPLCPPKIPHGLTRDRTRASMVGGRRLTAWAIARPFNTLDVP
jgi:hypothetical protein